MKTIAAYIRVNESTRSKNEQMTDIRKWITEQDIKHQSVQWYIDSISLKDTKYPDFEQLQRDIKANTIQTVIVHRLENICKSLASGAKILSDWCSKSVHVVLVDNSIEIVPEFAPNAHQLIKSLASLDKDAQQAKRILGIAEAKKQGKYKGRKPGTYKPGVNPKRVLTWKRRGKTIAQIAAKLNVSQATVFRYLNLYRDHWESNPTKTD